MGKGNGGIPNRWLPYTPMGSVIPGTRFVACKVPLKDALLRSLPPKDRFGPKDLLMAFPNIGLLVDLTNTDRYNNKQEFTNQNIHYEKIHCPGQVIPPNSIVKKFFTAVDTFLDKNKDSDSVIVVHCTHGVNRTGYFICRYMIEKLEIPPDEAVDRVQQARGHKIERNNYVSDLMNGCKGGSEADMRFAPKARRTNKPCNDRYEKEPSRPGTAYSRKHRTEIPLWSSRNGADDKSIVPEGRASRDNWRVRGPPADNWDEYDHHAPRGYPLNHPPRTPLFQDPYNHWQSFSNQRGPPPDLSRLEDLRYRKSSQNQLHFPPMQASQEQLSDHQPYQKQRNVPRWQPRSQQRLTPDEVVSTANELTGRLNCGKSSSFEHSFPKQPAPFPGYNISQQSQIPPFKSRLSLGKLPSFQYEPPPIGQESSCSCYGYPKQTDPHSTSSIPQQAGSRLSNSRQSSSSSWRPLPSFSERSQF